MEFLRSSSQCLSYTTCSELGPGQPSLDTRHSIYAHCAILPAQTTVNGAHWGNEAHDPNWSGTIISSTSAKVPDLSTETSTIFQSTGSTLGDVLAGASSCPFWSGYYVR